MKPIEKAKVRSNTTRGRTYTKKGKAGPSNKRPIVALVERGGNVRTFHVAVADKVNVTKIVRENIAKESRLHTDESRLYTGSEEHFAAHETVNHTSKRGMRGIYQHCSEKHLHRYLAEYEFRYNHRVRLGVGDIDRTYAAIRGVEGKRLMYRQPD